MADIGGKRLAALTAAGLLTIANIVLSIFSLKHGIPEIYTYLYIVPVILVAYISPRAGVYFTIVLGWLYLGLVYLYGALDLRLLASSFAWFYIFVSLGVLISAYSNEIVKQRKYQEIFTGSQAAIFTFHLNTCRIHQFNARLAHILGYTDRNLEGEDIALIWNDPADLEGFLRQLGGDGMINDKEAVFRKADGSEVWVQVTASVTGEDIVILSAVDVTARKQISDKLRQTEIQYQLLFDQAGDPIIIHDYGNRILAANRIAVQLSGYPLGELTAMNFTDLDIERCTEWTRQCMREVEARGTLIFETIHHNHSGMEIPVEISSSRFEFMGKPAVISIVRDISERKKAEAAIREREQRFRMTGDLIPYGVWIADAAGEFTYCSDSFLSLLGMTLEECRGLAWMKRLPEADADRTRHDWEEVVRVGGFWDYEYRMTDRKGREHFILSRGSPFRDSSGLIVSYVGIHLDITDRRQYENRLEASLAEKEVIIKEVHHRVKNNMQVISGFLQLQSTFTDDPAASEMLAECQRRVRSMALVHEKLYQSRHLGFINVAEYIKSLVSELQESYVVQADITFKVDVESVNINLDIAIPCGLIINELLTNSLKYAFWERPSGTITIELRLSPDHQFHLRVCDDGKGLPENFDIASTSTLGMQLVQVLVRQLGGTIAIVSKAGTCFDITFPEKF
ncbi:PAS domain S-box protein [Methanoregula sp. PtaB.Bin085]|uniref:sensor histidine kinase n=1 Tax=Methanoregula sp. PtaB.Bin085 TaxID=1811680 RepID=UPI0025FFCC88|nr:PAS domain S-box protein [Methanoregula sp. PtaB.Bin085]